MDNDQHGRDEGFALVEIVVAIVLVGILSAVAVVVGIGALTEKGSEAACTSSLDAAKAGAVVYLASNAAYPSTMLDTTLATPGSLTLADGVTLNVAAVGSNAPGTIATGENWARTT